MESRAEIQEALVRNDVELLDQKEEDEEEIEKIEAEVKEMGEKLLNYRTTLPLQLKSSLSSILVAQRPIILPTHFDSGSDSQPEPSTHRKSDVVRPVGSGNGALLEGEYQETEKIELLKQKFSSNASVMPVILKRMKDCMRRIDNLESCNGIIIPPAFKRKRTS